MRVQELQFRASQTCRVLGYPIPFAIVRLLLDRGPLTLQDIRPKARRSKQDLCHHLTRLRLAQIVRYERQGRETRYWIKYPDEVRRLVDSAQALAERAGRRMQQDS